MAFFGFQKTPSGVTTEDQAQAERSAAWQDLRRSGDLGNVLLNFGLNMMANSETQGLGAAMGGAGLNALQDYRSVMAARQKQANAEQARQDTLRQQSIQNDLAERRFGFDQKQADLTNQIALANLQAAQTKSGLDSYKTMMEIQRMNAARTAMGLPLIQMPGIPGMPSFGGSTTTSGSSGGTLPGGGRMFGDLKLNEANNNPGNLRGKGGVGNGYALYDTTLDGFRALDGLLQRRYQGMTPEQFVHVYAPASDGNNEAAYAAVLRKAGVVGQDGIIHVEDPKTRAALMKAIAAHEGPTSRFDLSEADMAAGLVPVPEGYKSRNLREQSRDWKAQQTTAAAPAAPATAQAPAAAPKTEAPAPAAQPAAQSGQQAGPSEAPIVIGGVQVTPQWIATRQQVAAMYPETNEGKMAKQELEFYKDEVEARRKLAKDSKEGSLKQSDISGLAKEFRSDTSSYSDAQEALSTALEAVKQKSGAGDLALVFSYMKALDPGSVVREGEQMMARKTGGVTDQFLGIIANLQSGQQLTPEVRMGLLRGAKGLVNARESAYQKRVDYYTGRAKRNGYDPLDIVYNPYPDLMKEVDDFMKGYDSQAGGVAGEGHVPGIAPASGGARAAIDGLRPYDGKPLPAGSTIVFGEGGKLMGVR